MKKRWLSVALAGVLCLSLAKDVTNVSAETTAEETGKTLDVIFTHDTHSHLNTFTTVVDNKETEIGGFARIKTLLNEQKKKNPDTLIVDGGDFSMGTLIQTVYESQAAELRMLGYLGCDVTTLGNHEFDYRSKGLADMLTTAAESGDELPTLTVCNVDWNAMQAEGLNDGQQLIKDAFDEYGVRDYTVVQKGDVDIAVFGVFGEDALACAPTCELLFKNPVEAAKETVDEIKENEDVDMIVCISHSGTWEDESKSEDEILAKSVPDIDLIISGHTHTTLDEPIVHGNTYVVSCGEYGRNIGSLSMKQNEDGRWEMSSYELIPITTEIAADEAAQERIDTFMDTVDTDYLADFGYTKDQVLAENEVDFCTQKDLYNIHEEHNLGDIMSDAYIYSVENASDFDGTSVDLAIVPSGTVRDTYAKGNITVEQVFNSFSLGIGADGVPGYPLISVYLTGAELKTLAEVDASISDLMTTARLYCSGMNFSYNPNRMILNKVTDVYLTEDDGKRVEIDDDKLYRVVSDLYSGQMLSAVTKMSKGLLSIVPKYADGTPIDDFEDAIITENGKELKAWDAIARYIGSFEDTDQNGIANVPEYYSIKHDRKVVDDSKKITDLIKNPNKFTAMIFGIIAVLILIIIFIILLIKKIVKKVRSGKNKKR